MANFNRTMTYYCIADFHMLQLISAININWLAKFGGCGNVPNQSSSFHLRLLRPDAEFEQIPSGRTECGMWDTQETFCMPVSVGLTLNQKVTDATSQNRSEFKSFTETCFSSQKSPGSHFSGFCQTLLLSRICEAAKAKDEFKLVSAKSRWHVWDKLKVKARNGL